MNNAKARRQTNFQRNHHLILSHLSVYVKSTVYFSWVKQRSVWREIKTSLKIFIRFSRCTVSYSDKFPFHSSYASITLEIKKKKFRREFACESIVDWQMQTAMRSKKRYVHSALVFMTALYVTLAQEQNPEVNTKYGRVRGVWLKTARDADIVGFLGLPYAQPPVDDLRFEVKYSLIDF